MNDNAYQRLPPSASSPILTVVQVDTPSPGRRRSTSKSKVLSAWKQWRRTWPTINVDRLVRMRLRWRTVAKILGGILFFKITLSMLGSLAGTGPSDVEYMVMPDGASARDILSNDSFGAPGINTTVAPPPPPPIPPPEEAITCETLRDYANMVEKAPKVDEWQTIQLGISFAFSAYFDDRLDGIAAIKVMALADEWLDAPTPFCQVWFPSRVEPFALAANVTNFPAQQTARYKSVMYTCSYKPTDPEMPAPVAISMSSEACGQPLSMFNLHLMDRATPIENRQKISVCLASPMRLNFSEPGEMVDWIEVHKIFGVSKYIMYEHDIADNVRPYMQHYIDQGTMEVVRWKLPADIRDPRESVKAFGQLSMINDCLYRNMFQSRYLVFLDLDEMMVPRGMSKNLEEVLVTTSCQDKAQTIIRSAFFRKQWTNDEKYASDERMVKRSLVSLLKTKRERKVLAINVHAKYIVIPEMIDALETLAALRFIPTVVNNTGEATCILLAKECLLHHYRYYEEFSGDWMIDRKLHEFTKLIVERTGAVFEQVAAVLNAQQQVAQATALETLPPAVPKAESFLDQPGESGGPPDRAAPDDGVAGVPGGDTAGNVEDGASIGGAPGGVPGGDTAGNVEDGASIGGALGGVPGGDSAGNVEDGASIGGAPGGVPGGDTAGNVEDGASIGGAPGGVPGGDSAGNAMEVGSIGGAPAGVPGGDSAGNAMEVGSIGGAPAGVPGGDSAGNAMEVGSIGGAPGGIPGGDSAGNLEDGASIGGAAQSDSQPPANSEAGGDAAGVEPPAIPDQSLQTADEALADVNAPSLIQGAPSPPPQAPFEPFQGDIGGVDSAQVDQLPEGFALAGDQNALGGDMGIPAGEEGDMPGDVPAG